MCCITITTEVMKSQVDSPNNFGEFFRLKRIARGLTLRTFCQRFGYDPGNISRLERNILPPTLDDEKLAGYARALQIKRDSEEWVLFHDLAHSTKGQIPEDIMQQSNVNRYLPLLFRTVRGKKLSKSQIKELIELLNKS